MLSEFGKVDHPCQFSGQDQTHSDVEVSDEEWTDILNTTSPHARACQVFGQHNAERNYGRIINIASLTSFVALS